MLNLQEFVNELSPKAFKELTDACLSRLNNTNESVLLVNSALTYAEKRLVEIGEKVSAIKSAKDRLGVDFPAAKKLVDGAIGVIGAFRKT